MAISVIAVSGCGRVKQENPIFNVNQDVKRSKIVTVASIGSLTDKPVTKGELIDENVAGFFAVNVIPKFPPPYQVSDLINGTKLKAKNDSSVLAENAVVFGAGGDEQGSTSYNFSGSYDNKRSILSGTLIITSTVMFRGERKIDYRAELKVNAKASASGTLFGRVVGSGTTTTLDLKAGQQVDQSEETDEYDWPFQADYESIFEN